MTRNGYDLGHNTRQFAVPIIDWFAEGAAAQGEAAMQSSKAKEHNLQAALDQLHADVYANNMAPYWVVDRTKIHDEDDQVMDKRKAIPFL